MRVLLDANILISYLVTPQGGGGAVFIVNAALAEEFVILVPEQLLDEVKRKAAVPRLVKRIRPDDVDTLLALLQETGETPTPITRYPSYTRDPKDDYLISFALAEKVHYLVSRDGDLLTLRQVGPVKIVSVTEFISILKSRRLTSKV